MNQVINTSLKGMLFLAISLGTGLAPASEVKCGVCSMKISENSRNHIVLKKELPNTEQLHTCSLSCAHKVRKYDPAFTKVEISDFNHPEKFLPGEKAFFLIQSKKILSDLGSMAMPPYFGAFEKKDEAESEQKKCGDGMVVQGFDNVFKKE